MFFIIGLTTGRKDLKFNQMVICSRKQYFVQTSCCGTVYRLDPEVGKRVARGEELEIRQEDLEPVSGGWPGGQMKRCPNCGYTTDEDFTFCPKCGGRF